MNNMKNELPEYIYNHLKKFGNTVISNQRVNRLGKNKIIHIIKKRGYDVEMIVEEHFEGKDVNFILQVKGYHR